MGTKPILKSEQQGRPASSSGYHYRNSVSTQADIYGTEPTAYESEDESMGRRKSSRSKRGTPVYSKEDIREQYCVNDKEIHVLENAQVHSRLFGCLSSYGESSCSSHSPSLLSACVRRKIPSDENLYELYRRPYDFPPLPRWPRAFPPLPPASVHCTPMYDDGAYFMRRPKSVCSDRNSYSWFSSEDEDMRLGRLPRPPDEIFDMYSYPLRRSPHYFSYSTEFLTPRPESCPAHPPVPPPPPPPVLPIIAHRPKHVSFARSHTLQSFDDISSVRSSLSRSQERLIDGKRTMDPKDSPKVVVVEKKKVKKTQATQTEVCLGRKPVPAPTYLSLSPRLGRKVKTVSQGAQTNGEGNRTQAPTLMKSYSELGGMFLSGEPPVAMDSVSLGEDDHDPLHRSQPEHENSMTPRSPHYTPSPCPVKSIMYSPKTSYASTSSKTYSHTSDVSSSSYHRIESPSQPIPAKEIMIDFKPNPSAEPIVRRGRKRILQKTRSEGEILVDQSLLMDEGEGSVSDSEHQYGDGDEPKEKRSPSQMSIPSSAKQLNNMLSGSSNEEEFHENLVYHSIFEAEGSSIQPSAKITKPGTPIKESKPPPTAPMKHAQSPSVSCDSLNTRDVSESHWNESQTTVLHDSDNNATAVSCSDLSVSLSPSAALGAMTPGSRRRHLLQLQHMQRSSMDTEALDMEDLETDKTVTTSVLSKSTPGPQRKEKSPELVAPTSQINKSTPGSQRKEKPPELITPTTPTTHISNTTSVPKFSVTMPGDEPKKIRMKKHYLTRFPHDHIGNKVIPLESKKFESSADQSVPCDLVRSDSGRTTTDMSEASTTDDYVTANNSVITETSGNGTGTGTHGSSFESASSKYSLDRDKSEDFQIVPCGGEIKEEIDEGIDETTSKSPTHENSSSDDGSYSVDEDKYPSSVHQASPDVVRSSHPEPKSISWTDEDRSKKKKHFKLELAAKKKMAEEAAITSPSKHISATSNATSPTGSVLKKSPTSENKLLPDPVSSMKTLRRPKKPSVDKVSPCIESLEQLVREQRISNNSSILDMGEEQLSPQRDKVPSTPQHQRDKVPSTPQLQREKIPLNNGLEDSSDDSSYECGCGRKRHLKESPRRKLGSKSPTSQGKTKRRSNNEERRRSLSIVKSPSPVLQRLSPSILKSPDSVKLKKNTISPEHSQLKALSAESLRSVSPGSDSVFYSEPNVTLTEDLNQDDADDDKTVCLPADVEYRRKSVDIVQPPAGFEDSPKPIHKTSTPKHSRKMEKRFRSEERNHHARMMEAQRAKSEERHREEQKENIRPLVRSTCNSMEKLRSSSAASFVYDEEDLCGIYSDPYSQGSWIHISDMDEFHIWQRPDSREGCVDVPGQLNAMSPSITTSELNFKRDYEERTRRMIHRKSYVEALHRKASKTLDSDKIVTVRKTPSGSFGFRIFGDYPTVVTAIEPHMPAENSGLEVGDIIMRINNIYVANSSHTEVLEITKAVSDTMELEVARTCDVLTPSLSNLSSRNLHVFSGPLWKFSQSDEIWVQRHFCLKQDNCLYYYKTESETIPLGALVLHASSIETTPGLEKPHSFRISKPNHFILDLAAESESVANQWLEYFTQACESQENIEWLSEISIKKPPSRILNPQHSGHLFVLGRSWKRRFCVLKNACLYIYSDISTDAAIGMICMHGYKIRSTTLVGKKFSFEIYPEDNRASLKHFYFHADSDMDKKRWMAEMEYSLGRWIRLL